MQPGRQPSSLSLFFSETQGLKYIYLDCKLDCIEGTHRKEGHVHTHISLIGFISIRSSHVLRCEGLLHELT